MRALLLLLALVGAPLPLAAQAQDWNAPSALALVTRGIRRRGATTADTALHDYKAHGHGFVFFLGQFGDGLNDSPRLIKTDQLELELYWKAPGASKQRIVGWRNAAQLPTDINYHRDHLGIIQNNFGRAIRLGEGDEVQDVPHPLSPGAQLDYDYALGDTQMVTMPGRTVRVVALRVRPKDFSAPRIVGTLYLDVATAALVRMTFDFTPASYRDPELEDVSVVLDQALWDGRFWLPFRQEIEIRRRVTWLDFSARGIIRGRWEIGDYAFNLGLADTWFAGEEISALPQVELDSFPWPNTLAQAMGSLQTPARSDDLNRLRAEAARIAGAHLLTGLSPTRLGVRSLSDLLHVNRVEGLTVGAGVTQQLGGAVEARVRSSYGFGDHRVKGRGEVEWNTPGGALTLSGYRDVRDISDRPVISPLFNSINTQEWGRDYGDYYLADGGTLAFRRGVGTQGDWSTSVGRERIGSLPVAGWPAGGGYAPNPPLGTSYVDVAGISVRRRAAGLGESIRHDLAGGLSIEGGRRDGGDGYWRISGDGTALLPVAATRVVVRGEVGIGSVHLPAQRTFVLGGRGTLLGDDYRTWGGRRAALVDVEWRVPVPFLSFSAAPYTRTPSHIVVAPYAAAGWTGAQVAGTPWRATPGTRVTLGVALEWLGLIRVEGGYGAESRKLHLALDVTRDFWGLL
ncbi:MAG TPA: hypothetical protein VH163_09030 [Gemmatimonadales bacterium]|nr:hypothetical protein [Gemmatimonadales bacterium]